MLRRISKISNLPCVIWNENKRRRPQHCSIQAGSIHNIDRCNLGRNPLCPDFQVCHTAQLKIKIKNIVHQKGQEKKKTHPF